MDDIARTVSVYFGTSEDDLELGRYLSGFDRKKGTELKYLALKGLREQKIDVEELKREISQQVTSDLLRTLIPIIQGLSHGDSSHVQIEMPWIKGKPETNSEVTIATEKVELKQPVNQEEALKRKEKLQNGKFVRR